MTPRIIIRRVLLTANQQLRMKQAAIITRANLINRTRIQIDKDGTRNIFAAARLGEDGVELARVVECRCFGVGATVLLEAVLEEVAGRLEVSIL